MKRYLVQKEIYGVYRNYNSFNEIKDALLVCTLIKEHKCRIFDRKVKTYINHTEPEAVNPPEKWR